MYAVILSGGKQYRVEEGEVVSVEKLDAVPGRKIDFDRVLLLEDGQNITVGVPEIAGAVVTAEVIETYKDEKIIVFRKKRTKQFRRTRGHRQQLTKVRIEKVWAGGKPKGAEKPEPEAAAEPEKPAAAPVPETVKPVEKKPRKSPGIKKAVKAEVKGKPKTGKGPASKAGGPKKRAKSKE